MKAAILSMAVAIAVLCAVPSAVGRRPTSTCAGRLVSSSFGYANCSTGTFVTSDGRHWRRVAEQAAWFLDRLHGWKTTNDCGLGRATLSRTSDAGRTWRSTPIRAVNCSAGSYHDVSFADARSGWLLAVFGNAYILDLYRTGDGGRTWRFVQGDLPIRGAIELVTPRTGWLARSEFSFPQRLYVTGDGGSTWRRRSLRPPPGWFGARMFPDVPTFFGRRGVLAVSLTLGRRSGIAFYSTSDAGKTWRFRAVLSVSRPVIESPASRVSYVPSAVASPTVWWCVAGKDLRTFQVTADAGRSWRVVRAEGLPASVRVELTAVNRTRAWLTAVDPRYRSSLYATSDGGRSWGRLTPR